MTKDEALRLALETFESMSHKDSIFAGEFDEEITAIKAALEAKDEPPRFPTMLRKMWSGGEVQNWINEHWVAPPQRTWVGLTNEELADCWDTIPERAMRRVEVKLKELNT